MERLRAIADLHARRVYYFLLEAILSKDIADAYKKEHLHQIEVSPGIALNKDYWDSLEERLMPEVEQYRNSLDAQHRLRQADPHRIKIFIGKQLELAYELLRKHYETLSATSFSTLYHEGVYPSEIGFFAENNGHQLVYLDEGNPEYEKKPNQKKRENFWVDQKIVPLQDDDSIIIAGAEHIISPSHLTKRLSKKGIGIEIILDCVKFANQIYSQYPQIIGN